MMMIMMIIGAVFPMLEKFIGRMPLLMHATPLWSVFFAMRHKILEDELCFVEVKVDLMTSRFSQNRWVG